MRTQQLSSITPSRVNYICRVVRYISSTDLFCNLWSTFTRVPCLLSPPLVTTNTLSSSVGLFEVWLTCHTGLVPDTQCSDLVFPYVSRGPRPSSYGLSPRSVPLRMPQSHDCTPDCVSYLGLVCVAPRSLYLLLSTNEPGVSSEASTLPALPPVPGPPGSQHPFQGRWQIVSRVEGTRLRFQNLPPCT